MFIKVHVKTRLKTGIVAQSQFREPAYNLELHRKTEPFTLCLTEHSQAA